MMGLTRVEEEQERITVVSDRFFPNWLTGLSAMRYWREVNNEEVEVVEEVEVEEEKEEVKKEEVGRQNEGDATLTALEMLVRAIIAGASALDCLKFTAEADQSSLL